MSALSRWLSSRRPLPPPDLAEALRPDDRGGARQEVLAAAAKERLDAARRRPGRVRESAFHLLEADALLTYACEAALETADPERALRRVLATAAG